MKVAFDSRPTKSTHGVGRYARCLLEALRDAGHCEVVETHEPRRCELYHSPWIDGALLRCPVPMVVTLHDLAPLKRHGQYLRSRLRFKLRYLAVQRATRVIVPTYAVAEEVENVLEVQRERIAVIPEAPAPALHARSEEEVSAVRHQFSLPERYLVWVGTMRTPDPRKRIAQLTRATRSMPLVLVGPTAQWARELPGVRADRRGQRRRARRDLHRRPRARVPERRRGLRAASGRGARVRDPGRGLRRPRPAGGSRRPRDAQPASTTSTA